MTRTYRIAAYLATVLLLNACQREMRTTTAPQGNAVVVGQVLSANGGSPAGVEVSAVGGGMSVVLDGEGRFTFVGVGEGSELRFRRADGIDVRVTVSSGTPLVLELDAQGGSRRRTSIRPKPLEQFEGLIVSVTDAELVLADAHSGEVTIVLGPETQIRKGNDTLTAADLKAGDRVHVQAKVDGDVKTAVAVMLQNPGDDDQGGDDDRGGTTMTANGEVTAVGGSGLTVRSKSKGEVKVEVTSATIIKKQGKRIAVSEIRVGDEANCRGTKGGSAGSMTAVQIEVRGNSKGPN